MYITELARGGVPDYAYYKMEGETNVFSGNLLAPPILIHKHLDFIPKIITAIIRDSFELSERAAERRLVDYEIWKKLKVSKYEELILKKHWKSFELLLKEVARFYI